MSKQSFVHERILNCNKTKLTRKKELKLVFLSILVDFVQKLFLLTRLTAFLIFSEMSKRIPRSLFLSCGKRKKPQGERSRESRGCWSTSQSQTSNKSSKDSVKMTPFSSNCRHFFRMVGLSFLRMITLTTGITSRWLGCLETQPSWELRGYRRTWCAWSSKRYAS